MAEDVFGMVVVPPPTLAEQIAEIDRELRLRDKIYPRWVGQGKMQPSVAALNIARLRAARESLVRLQALQSVGKSVGGAS